MNVLITGGAGFIGSAVCQELLARRHQVHVLDCLTYAGRKENVPDGAKFWQLSLSADPIPVEVDAVVHCAAETHVDRAFNVPGDFVRANLEGTLNLLEWARYNPVKRFVHVSTDEVFGASTEPRKIDDRLDPSNPYAATKAGAEHLARSYQRCFNVPAVIARSCNVFGPRQHHEKFIPGLIKKILNGDEVIIHTGPDDEPGRRRWAHVTEVAKALANLAESGEIGRTYHVAETFGRCYDNLQVATMVANLVGRPLDYRLERSPRPAYDAEYNLEPSPEAWGWKSELSFEKLLQQTVAWYLANPEALA